MKTQSSQRRQTNRRRVRAGSIVGILLVVTVGLGCAQRIFSSSETPRATQTPPVPIQLARDVEFTWPATASAAIGNAGSGVLAQSSPDEVPRPTASMAKVITALAVLEKRPIAPGQPGEKYTLTAQDVAHYTQDMSAGGSVMPVYVGMEITQREALQLMLMVSANNMADTLVDKTFGSQEAYVTYAQSMVRKMGLAKTTVADASGMSPATVSTPSELVRIGIAALANPAIAHIVSQAHADIPGVGVVANTNQLLGDNGVIGIKTGTTDEAGSCLMVAAKYVTLENQPVTIVGVVMGEDDAETLYRDSDLLLTLTQQSYGLRVE